MSPTMAIRGRLNAKEGKLIKGIASGKKIGEAALDAEMSPSGSPEAARVAAYNALRRPHVAAALEKALDEVGATVQQSARVIAAAHKAHTVRVFNDPENGVTYSKGLVDHGTRLKAAEINLKARRLIGSGEEQGPAGSINLVAVLQIVKESAQERGLPL